MPDDFEQMWSDLAPLGRSASSGGYFRQPFTSAETELRAWFGEQCAARDLTVEADGNGNLLAWWGARLGRADAVLIGSHLDSVLDGGAYDGPLGVVSSLAADRPAAVARRAADAADRGRRLRRGGGLAVRDRLPRLPAGHRGDDAATRRASCATATAYPCSTRWRTAGVDAVAGPRRLARPDRLLRRAARRAGPRPRRPRRGRRAGHARSGRTGATASTSPARPTTPGRPGWRTGTTRCSATR